jgi:integrase
MKRARKQFGSVVSDKRIKTWHYLWQENGKRRSKLIGHKREFPTKAAAWEGAKPFIAAIGQGEKRPSAEIVLVTQLVEQYRVEKMPKRASTRRGYETWFINHIEPKWGKCELTELQARPVELWLDSLDLAPKSKAHIRGLLSVIWDYAMWRGDVPTARNPMELVKVKDASKPIRKTRSLSVEQFQLLLKVLNEEDPCFRTMVILAISFGLRISEVLGFKWCDVDWLNKTLRIERGVVKQIVDNVKTSHSARTMACADEVLGLLKNWRQTSLFSTNEDWMFASIYKLGRQPVGYTSLHLRLEQPHQGFGTGWHRPCKFSHVPALCRIPEYAE